MSLKASLPSDGKVPVIEVHNATFLRKIPNDSTDDESYDEEAAVESSQVALKNIDGFQVFKGQLVCVVGRVGAGKSTFLQALLGQLPCISNSPSHASPTVHFRANSVALCSQQSWIMNASVKDNVLFGHRFDEATYKATLEACQLVPDLEILADGDETLVGEKGISLSGGQKARLSLARAVYSRSDVYLLDDILSAVDAEVCKRIIEQVLSKKTGLLKNKTVILTTNSISVLKHSQSIYALEDGEIVESGSFNDIMRRDDSSKLKRLIVECESENTKAKIEPVDSEIKAPVNLEDVECNAMEEEVQLQVPVEGSTGISTQYQSRKASMATLRPREIIDINADTRKTAQKEEKKEKGRVKTKVYMTYLKACGYFGAVFFLIFMGLSRALLVSENFWLKHWSEDNERNGGNSNVLFYVGIYVFISLSAALLSNARTIVLLLVCSIKASFQKTS